MSELPTTGKVLEVPSGTGLFLCEFLRKNPNWSGIGVDLADSSIKFSQKLFQINNIPNNSYKILKMNFHQLESNEKYDFKRNRNCHFPTTLSIPIIALSICI